MAARKARFSRTLRFGGRISGTAQIIFPRPSPYRVGMNGPDSAGSLRALVDNSLWYRQTTAFAGRRVWRAPEDGVRSSLPSPVYRVFVHGHDRATGLLYA